MSKSFRDQKPQHLANRKLNIKSGDEKVLPRIIERKPYPGDIHPIDTSALRRALKLEVPQEYLYGISRIELRPRQGPEIGQPYGVYFTDEKSIILYSLPLEWRFSELSESSAIRFERAGAKVEHHDKETKVKWESRSRLAFWFFTNVVIHELGHHYRHQYKISVGSPGSTWHEEYQADIHAKRILDFIFKRIRAKRNNV